MDLRSGPLLPPRGRRVLNGELQLEVSQPLGKELVQAQAVQRLSESDRERNYREESESSSTELLLRNVLAETPETTVGENVHIKGELSFERLLRVDGSFNGKLASNGDLVVGEKGVIRGNIIGLREIVSDGTIFGDIGAERLRLRRSAVVIGDVTCRSLSVDPDVSISGRLNIHREAPSRLRLEGEYTPEDEVADSGSDDAHDANDKTSRGHDRNHKSNLGANKRSGSSKKDNGNKNKDRHEKGDKNKDDAHRIKAKDGDPSESGESKATKKE